MNVNRRVLLNVVYLAVLAATAFALSARGRYGWTLFVIVPLAAGAFAACIFQPRTASRATLIGAAVGASGCLLFLVLGAEGFICVLLAAPIVVPLAILGSLLIYWGAISSNGRPPAVIGLLLPISLFYDVTAKPPVYSVTTSIVVNAPRERVWENVVAFPDISDQADWVLRTGLAYPIRTRIERTGVGAARSCDLSTGTVQERVVVWDEPGLLRFIVTATPPAMRELGLYGPIHPKHLDGYYVSKEGQFELTPLRGGRTLVVGTSWYQHGLWPAGYWRWWADLVIHHIHQRVLNHIRARSESGSSRLARSASARELEIR